MTTNKAQGRTLGNAGVHLWVPRFYHNQVYVTCSAVVDPLNLLNETILANVRVSARLKSTPVCDAIFYMHYTVKQRCCDKLDFVVLVNKIRKDDPANVDV
ncbi:hypothetical protein EVAR_39367_1 [Eumeta japonica]|uniref:Uncharacterized protein n=1 Tax=Eumeta variegata TaxID=151549 RepID=A0A4C1WN75_EUMVA|nr:hypothetical protein EVAR_39367_1 [Eumeta japonica]